MSRREKPWALALVYVALSLAVEAALMVIGRLRVPRDNAILALIVLTVPPLLAAWLTGRRRLRDLLPLAVLLSVLTLILTLAAGRVTGIKTGLAEPLIVRSAAGFLAGLIMNRIRPGPGDGRFTGV
ncbi:MAG: hypothetical protein FJ221_12435 [Lentisphaerae bacterium]|nr:hypothetical protein [Lentisphaerota bacterium]